MLKWQKPKNSQKEIRLSEIGKELDFIEMQIQNPKLLRSGFRKIIGSILMTDIFRGENLVTCYPVFMDPLACSGDPSLYRGGLGETAFSSWRGLGVHAALHGKKCSST